MMQNHQMHQLVVQQMMLHSLPGGRMTQAPVTYMSEPTVVVSQLSLSLSLTDKWILDLYYTYLCFN